MEEIDKIILHTLRQIGCDLEEEVDSIGQFTTENVVDATSRCLRLVSPGLEVPLSLPPSMSARFRVGASLAQACTELGYKGDIGYQTFLYSTEADIRRVFMFLIEKLPKESEKVVDEPLGGAQAAKQLVCERLRQQLAVPWLPVKCRHRGVTVVGDNSWLREGFSSTQAFSSVPLALPDKHSNFCPAPVVEQVSHRSQLLPSLIAFNSHALANPGHLLSFQGAMQEVEHSVQRDWSPLKSLGEVPKPLPRHRSLASEDKPPIPTARNAISERLQPSSSQEEGEGEESVVQKLQDEAESLAERVQQLQLEARALTAKAAQVGQEAEAADVSLKDQEERFGVQKHISELLPEAEVNVSKLQSLVEASAKRLTSLAAQWERHRAPLVNSYRHIREKNSHKVSESQRQAESLQSVRDKMRELGDEARSKEQLHRQLTADCDKLTKDISRSSYTRRILEIIGNIRKQKEEIDRVLADTRQVQKEINQLTGRLDRSFAVADELIFKDAKREEAARKAYKLLATLHADCAELVTLVQETGATMREIRDLEDQIEIENAKNVGANLERITADLRQMKQESASLMAQLKSKS